MSIKAEDTPSRSEAGALAWIAVQVGVILVLARAFNLESPAFYDIVLPLTAGGFLIHHWLPRAWQPWFFAALSFTGIGLIFGFVGGAWLVGIGLGLIALCHLPIAFRWRIGLILLAAAALVAMRAAWLPTPWPGAVWPVLGSMFMFRLGMYLYDLKHRGPGAPGFVLSYFFLLPNSVFLLFPVIDFQTFRRTHYDKPALAIYGEGVRWMFRGLTHLVLYRLIYQYVALSPADVTSTATLVQYLVGNYGLYLRVSGQFHMIVGLLHLFGFRLPETHRFFYLASSFSDLWRRINIYWKDFMQKMVYLPVVFGLKRHGETPALVVATLCVVTATWLLHSYQWFWLLGDWLLSATDMAFWGVIGLLLMVNTLREQRRGRARQLTAQAPASPHAWRDAVQTAGMFAVMVVLWGVWTSPTFEDFRVMVRAATLRTVDVTVVVSTLGIVALAAYVTRRYSLGTPSALAVRPRWQHPLVVGALPLALVWIVGHPALEGRVPTPVHVVAQQARVAELNKTDAERMQRGYYERIVGVNRFNGELWEVYARADAPPEADDVLFGEMMRAGPGDTGIWRRHEDELGHSLIPLNRTTFKGARFTTNQWGMRDQDYEKSVPSRTRRIAVLGQSYTMGVGVANGETFEALVEQELNRRWSDKTNLQYEVLNFAVSGYTLDKQLLILQNGRVGGFQPGVVLLVGNPGDEATIADSLLRQFRRGVGLPDAVATTMKEAGVTDGISVPHALRLLYPYRRSLARWALENIASETRRIGAQPVYALIPMPKSKPQSDDVPLVALAAEAGFLVIDLEDVYAGHNPRLLTVSDSDFHPNANGHRIIAERLFGEMSRLPPGILAPEDPLDAENNTRRWAEWNRSQIGVRKGPEPAPGRGRGVDAGRAAMDGRGRGAGREGRGSNAGPLATDLPMEGWEIDAREDNRATVVSRRAEGWMRVNIEKLSSQSPSSIRLRKGPVSVTRARRYELKFWMKADSARPVMCGIASSANPDRPLGTSTRLDAGTWWQEFSCAIRATATETTALIFFDLGTSDAALELSKVELHDLSTGTVIMSTDPAWKPPAARVR